MVGKFQGKKQRTENQHYVPQFYLRGFTDDTGRMFCYDKVASRSYLTSTEAAAQERYFYEIPPGSFRDHNVPVNTVEKALCVVEKTWAPLHALLIKYADTGRIPARLTIEYAPFLVTQWMRTKTFRDGILQVTEKCGQSIVDTLVAINSPGNEHLSPIVTLKKGVLSAMHSRAIFDQKLVKKLAKMLEFHYWVVGINRTGQPFYTSDNPVVRRGNLAYDGRPLVGVTNPGVEFVFPLDGRHILLILERQYFGNWRQYDNRTILLTADQVRDYNALQVVSSNQRVLCAEDEFDLAREVCAARTDIRDPNRPRFLVETTPITSAGIGEDGKEELKNYLSVTALE
jgi:hypothetical protein